MPKAGDKRVPDLSATMGAMRRLAIAAGLMLALLSVPGAAHGAPSLAGPPGASASKVLVIGTDGTRIDLVQRLVAAGRAPRLASLGTEGFAVPSLLAYQPPEAATLSEVGWSSIATGVWPAKHGVRGIFVNNDPGQATKNGYPDFLTRLEQVRPGLSTFLVSNWANIGRHENGGPIFGDRIDARYALAAPGTIEGWDQADQEVTDVAARYLREGDPDAGFVYLGVVDEVAHLAGSRTPRYLQAIEDTDRRIGQLLTAIRARPTYLSERWAVIVTTDHGQQDLDYPSNTSHGFGSDLERTSFVAAAGFGLARAPAFADIRIVDIAPTVFARLGLRIDPAWNLDGRAFAGAPAVPKPTVTAGTRGRRLTIEVRAPAGAPGLAVASIGLPSGVAARSVRVSPRARIKRRRGRRVVTARLRTPGARRLRMAITARRRVARARLRVTVTDVTGTRTTRTVRPRR